MAQRERLEGGHELRSFTFCRHSNSCSLPPVSPPPPAAAFQLGSKYSAPHLVLVSNSRVGGFTCLRR